MKEESSMKKMMAVLMMVSAGMVGLVGCQKAAEQAAPVAAEAPAAMEEQAAPVEAAPEAAPAEGSAPKSN